ncbi:translation initiation factor IF-2 [Arcicella aurantiaca]|uniref:Translation initiation factor IF-2 n=1 Tax=Arcicella aurantiaca TaxID=591202 RepID=A0A316ESR8_9BACT|nr:translation initiation factor IF-2 [Arcicella aurantiaca]PWK26200.1 translation initiation factor IF-2 [Arcicella aurantiaca]
MAEDKMMRLSLVAKQIGVGTSTIVQKLSVQGHRVENNPNAKLNFEQLKIVAKEFGAEYLLKESAPAPKAAEEEVVVAPPVKRQDDDYLPLYSREGAKNQPVATTPTETPKVEEVAPEPEKIVAKAEIQLKVIGKVELDAKGNVIPPKPVVEPKPEPQIETPKVEEVKPVVVEVVEQPKAVEPVVEIPVKIEEAPKPIVEEAKPEVIEKPVVEAPIVEKPVAEVVQPVVEKTPVAEVVEQPKASEQPVTQPNNPVIENKPQQVSGGNNQNPQNKPQGGYNQNPQNKQQGGGNNQNFQNQNRQQGGNGNNQNPQNKQQGSGNNTPQQPKPQDNNTQNQANKPIQQPDNKPQKLGRNDAIPEDTSAIELIEAKGEQLRGLKVLGKIELPVETGRGGNNRNNNNNNKKKRKRIDKPGGAKVTEAEIRNEKGAPRPKKDGAPVDPNAKKPTGGNTQGGGQGNNNNNNNNGGNNNNNNNNKRKGNNNNNTGAAKPQEKGEVTDKQIQDQIKATMARLQGQSNKSNFGAKERREKRKFRADRNEQRQLAEDEEAKILKVTEFISASELASLMDVSVNEIISSCMSLGMFVSINQRLEADVIALITEEFGFEVQFVSAEEEIEAAIQEEEDSPEDLEPRAPIVTIMGHVDHGKTSLLDYIRRAKVAAGEAGGITQHIGAYSVKQDDGRRITFLDTPGHEAFTAMRARGAKLTDVAIIVIAADDAVMPQTEEAINHAMVAGLPIVFAFSKIDKPGANTEKIREQLSIKNILVEEWGGKYQTQELSSKSGMGVNELLEKVLLEAEMLELTANANKRAVGTVVEASLDKGRGYVANILVQAGTLKVGDMMLAGAHYGRVKAMFDYRGNKLKTAGPSTPVQVLGLSGAPAAGDKLSVMENERDAREIAHKREQILREQSLRTRKHITLEEIGRRKAIGTFKELNVIVKGDVDGSVEALSDSLLKLSTEEVQVRIIHKGVGQVSESDVLLASASDAVIVAFQVRPSTNARRLAENEQIEIRTYSVIYQAIDDVRDAMEGLLAPTFEEVITANIEVRDVFKISKVGTVAGSYVLDGTVKRSNKIRVIRDFVVIHEGEISALKRFKDDVAEVKFGYECGLSIKNFNDLEVSDIIECYEMKEVKRTL